MALNRDWDLFVDGIDNCPGVSNDAQTNTDEDGLGDPCDPTPVPQPTAISLLAAGFLGLSALHRRVEPGGFREPPIIRRLDP